MKSPLPHLRTWAFFLVLNAGYAEAAERFHLEPALPSQLIPDSAAAAVSSGGNVAQYPNAAGTVPHDSNNQFFLAESSIGYCGPTTEAGFTTRADLNAVASSSITSGTLYKTAAVPGDWRIVFPGVVDVINGGQASGPQNFYPDKVLTAVNNYRAVALAFPNDLQAKIDFINALRELMVPHCFAGNNAFSRAAKERIIAGPLDIPASGQPDMGNFTASNREEAALINATDMYHYAAAQFIDLMGAADSVQVAFPDTLPAGVAENSAIVQQLRAAQKTLCSAYARALGYKGETLLRTFQLRYLKNYAIPTLTTPLSVEIRTLLTSIDDQIRSLDYSLLITASLEGNTWFPTAEYATARSFLGSMKDLRDAVHNAFLSFSGLDNSLAIKANAYGPEFVPFFFDPYIFPGKPTTFIGLFDFARLLATASENTDNASANAIITLDTNLASVAQRLNDINDQYRSQLGQLCGWKIADLNGVPTQVPDVDGAIMPPERRPDWELRNRNDQGDIGLQWLEIDAAEQAWEGAMLSLQNILDSTDKKRETWQLIKASREDMIQNVIISTGQKIDQLNKDAIEAKAKFAEYLARQAKKKKKRSLLGNIVHLVAGPFAAAFVGGSTIQTGGSDPLSIISSYANGLSSTVSQYKEAGNAIREMQNQADLERKLGEINAKKEELAYLEKAGIQFQQIQEEAYRVEEAINSLLLEQKSAELQIEMAELRVDREYTKLSSMLSRVSYLLQQQAASFSLVNTNPLNSPDFRIIRDRTVREAEERFIFAQEWAFLTGRAASYVALGSTRRANIDAINADILKARSGRRLGYLLDRLQSEMNFVTIDLGSRASQKVTISVRDQLVQHNNITRSANGTANTSAPYPWEAQQVTSSDGTVTTGNTQAISDEAWLDFLVDHLIFPTNGNVLRLEIPFRLTLNRWASPDRPTSMPKNPFTQEAPLIENPLFSATRKGVVIFYSQGSSEFFGTRVDVLGSGIDFIDPTNAPVSVRLSPEGASYVRQQTYNSDPTGSSVLVFQLGSNTAQATIEASLNGVGLSGSGQQNTNRNAQLHERSPANDRWVLSIHYDEPSNRRLLEQLDKIRDIRISFSLSSF